MSTLKERITEIAQGVAIEFDGWIYASDKFKNKSHKFAELIVDTGITFDQGFAHLQPCIAVNDKKISKFIKDVTGYSIHTSAVNFQVTDSLLGNAPKLPVPPVLACEKKAKYIDFINSSKRFSGAEILSIENNIVDVGDIPSIFRDIMKSGISFLNDRYCLDNETAFLESLPAKYETRNEIIYDEWERQKGVVMCAVRLLLGDFDFVERYRSDDFKTIYPKRISEIENIIKMIPDLKRRYAETGSVI